ncbi:MAG: tRNA (adenosine(37)-N6)-threonylcarbamoyltransferase complex transferase subunit TsaD [Alphaproteobacteria bacterium]|nr:MAG: tRNA (adenosine(37)-N6)-threonylcarbamoyltransferase complex transferase subunit TsaD [Alphaproteobacteria bacterium]
MIVLGIETSCDETAAAVVAECPTPKRIRSNEVYGQEFEHAPFGGVVPEIAARAHLEHLDAIISRALVQADVTLADIDGVAAAAGPGLIGGLIVGAMTAKGIAWAANKPYIAVNHLEAHALTARLTDNVAFPYLLLLVSGGHCQLLLCKGVGSYVCLGTTLDDAAGEAFDKSAKLIGLGYPGGPAIERIARGGDPHRFALPRPLKGRRGCDFSFSGLKTAVRLLTCERGPLDARDVADLAASVERAICEALVDRAANAIAWFRHYHPEGESLVAAGGVAANGQLRHRLAALAADSGLGFVAPPPELCTDNAAMIAWAGIEHLRLGLTDGLDSVLRPRWPLDATPQQPWVAALRAC